MNQASRTAERALEVGPRRVIVRHPASIRPLHGVLLTCQVGAESGPPARELVIEVPEQYVLETSGGRRTNVYEGARVGIPGGFETSVAWRLWLQEVPF